MLYAYFGKNINLACIEKDKLKPIKTLNNGNGAFSFFKYSLDPSYPTCLTL